MRFCPTCHGITLDKGSRSVTYNQSQRQPVYDTNTGVYNVKLGEEIIIQCDSYRTKLKYLSIGYGQWHSLLSIYSQIPGLFFMPSPATSRLPHSRKVEDVRHRHTVAASSHTHCRSMCFLSELLGHQFTPHDGIQEKFGGHNMPAAATYLGFSPI